MIIELELIVFKFVSTLYPIYGFHVKNRLFFKVCRQQLFVFLL